MKTRLFSGAAAIRVMAVILIGLALLSTVVILRGGAVAAAPLPGPKNELPQLPSPVSSDAKTSTALESIGVSIAANTLRAGTSSSIDVVISSAIPARAAQFMLQYDPRLILVDNVTEGDYFRS